MPPKKPAATKTAAKGPAKPAARSQPAKGAAAKKPAAAAKKPAAAASSEAVAATEVHVLEMKVTVKEIDKVVLRDENNTIKDSGKWPLVIDHQRIAVTFLRYRDTNCIEALSPNDMDPQRIRRALIGSIRYGKPFVLDMADVDMFDTCAKRFDEIQPGLMDMIMNKTILKEDNYMKLVKEEDGDEYKPNVFFNVDEFKFVIVTQLPAPPPDLVKITYHIRVENP